MRRLAKDHAVLRSSTPPNYLFLDEDDSTLPDDLTQLIVLMTGTQGTPYSQGLWKLHLKMPEDYPTNPPKATFKTRIFHPNVDETTGAVCLETLKRDWHSKLTLKDILVSISCLLINPNPDSALNAEAGSLLQEDYNTFARKVKLMTSIHASIPIALKHAVTEAKRRGEDEDAGVLVEEEVERPASNGTVSNSTSVTMKSKASVETTRNSSSQSHTTSENEEQESEDDTKENDPLHSPWLPSKALTSPRKVLGKRALADLPMPMEPAHTGLDIDRRIEDPPSEIHAYSNSSEPRRKSPKLTRSFDEPSAGHQVYSDEASSTNARGLLRAASAAEDKENSGAVNNTSALKVRKTLDESAKRDDLVRPTLRKVSNVGSSRGKSLARVGIRRL